MKRGTTDLNFLIAINKTTGMTSHDVVNRIRTITGEGRVGHMGTLDPLASGVMIVGVGSAARLNNYLEGADKSYLITAEFGCSTSTYDAEGEPTERSEVDSKIMNPDFAEKYVKNLIGKHIQKPPMYSAIKIDGKPAYKSARKGDDIDMPEREIEVYAAQLYEAMDNQ